jgi:heme-degrading monooxygenase HmoA
MQYHDQHSFVAECFGMFPDRVRPQLQGLSGAQAGCRHSPRRCHGRQDVNVDRFARSARQMAGAVKAHVSGFVAGLPGNAGGAFLIDREGGKALTLTLWESEEAAAETGRFADQSRASTVEATGVELVDRGAYEVVMRL